jgi:hypothetical protein
MKKESTCLEHFRELMGGENQCGKNMEWALELQTETLGVGFDGCSSDTRNLLLLDTG